MTKLFIFLFTLTLAAIGAMWFIENDGSIVIEWLGYRVQTSVAFTILASVVILVLCTTILQILIFVKSAPKKYRRALKEKRRENGLDSLTKGFAAIAAGDIKEAKRLTKQASNYLGPIPLTKLLSAQTAQLDGNNEGAQLHYTSMLDDKETEIIAIKGLLSQARNEGDMNKALFLAQKAFAINPNAVWVISILMDLYKITRRWPEAASLTQRAAKLNLITATEYNRAMALIYLGMSGDASDGGNDGEALKFAKKAYNLLPAFVPVVTGYSKALIKSGKLRKAASILEKGWKLEPHPDIANLYMQIYNGENGAKLLRHAEKLQNLHPHNIDGHILVARTAMLAGDFIKAHNQLEVALSITETVTLCNLMADLEYQQGGDKESVEQWRKRAVTSNPDSVWVCDKCGYSTKKWKNNCKNCHSFDSFQWGIGTDSKVNIIHPNSGLLTSNSL